LKEHLEEYTKKTKMIYVNDGDNISVIVKLQPSVSDPMLQFPAIANIFRVVASAPTNPVLKLVPLGKDPMLLTEIRKEE
jgi:hypothetical protein